MNTSPSIDAPQTNILGLSNPDQYLCHFTQFHYVHPSIVVRLIGAPKASLTLLQFDAVLYMNFPLLWGGANVCIAGRSETIQFMQQIGMLSSDLAKADFETTFNAMPYRYYYIDAYTQFDSRSRIKILAKSCLLLDSQSELFNIANEQFFKSLNHESGSH